MLTLLSSSLKGLNLVESVEVGRLDALVGVAPANTDGPPRASFPVFSPFSCLTAYSKEFLTTPLP